MVQVVIAMRLCTKGGSGVRSVSEEMYAVFVAQRMEEPGGSRRTGFESGLVEVEESGETEADTQNAT